MNDTIRMFIGNEEVVCSNEFTINQEMLSASSTILNNCYPKNWELTKDYISNFYYPEDYSKFIIGNGNHQYGTTEYSALEKASRNLFDDSLIQIGIAWNNATNTARAIIIIPVKPSTDYTISFNSISNLEGVYAFGRENQNDSTRTMGNFDITGTKTLTTTANTHYLGLQFNKTSISKEDITNCLFQVEEGNQATTYEPYNQANLQYETNVKKEWNKLEILGNSYQKTSWEPYGVMPSPDYPSEIQNVGYENLLKYPYYATLPTTQAGITWNNDNGKIIASGTATGYSGFTLESNLPVQANTNYKIYIVGTQTNVTVDITGTGLGINVPTTSLNNSGYIFNTGNATTITINIKRQSNSLVEANFYPMLVLADNKSTQYVPYGKYGIEVLTTGKNLSALGNYNIEATSLYYVDKLLLNNFKNNTTYTLSFDITSTITPFMVSVGYGNIAFQAEMTGGNLTNQTNGHKKITFTTNNTTYSNLWIRMPRYSSATTYQASVSNIMLVKGNEEVEYEPYKENTQLYVLDEPLRAIGDVKDIFTIENNKLTIIRKIRHIELAIADMNNSEDYPGWTNFAETTQIKDDYPNKNTFLDYVCSYNCNIGIQSEHRISINTNGNGIIFLQKEYNDNLTQTQWKTNFPNLIFELDYVLPYETTYTLKPVELPYSYEGQNNVSINSGLSGRNTIYYYWKNYDVLFSGIVKNSGEISLNPRDPHYCNLQVLDYKTFLSESNTLDFVISNKTIIEAIQMVVNAVSGYGFVVGNIGITQGNDIIGAYSTLNQSAYDVLQYLANISGSRWRTRYVDSDTMAIDFYDPDLLPQANDILYTKQYYEDNNIIDITFSYGTRDYRNKQIVLSDEIYGDIDYTENLYADGYNTTYILQENIGVVNSVSVNGIEQEVITKEEKDNGVDGDFWYTPGKDTIESKKILSVNSEIVVVYTPLIKGRQIIYNSDEVQRVATNTNTIGVIARYETRNDILSSQELNQVGQTYISYKGKAEILLTIRTKDKDLFNIGEVAYFNAPITELQQNYMVKTKNIEYVVINGTPTLFYEYQLTSSYNNEKAINFFDNQRNKAQGNITLGKSITRNIDIENEATIIWQNLTITEVTIDANNNNTLNSSLNSPLIN